MAQRQRKQTEARMRLLVERYKKSGQSVSMFCRHSGTPVHVLRYWIRKYGGAIPDVSATGFRQIRVVSAASAGAVSATAGDIVLETSLGIRLRFPADYPAEALCGIIRGLLC